MKQIKDYIGKNYAIQCNSKEEWDKISKLTGNTKPNYFKDSLEGFFDLNFLGNYFSTWGKKKIEEEGYTTLKAEEFLEPESLVGRYLKCLNSKSNWRSNLKKGDCFQITKVDSDGHFYIDHFCLDKNRVQELKEFELMPNGWTPEKEKPKFEKDKWYIIDCYSNSYYVKFDKLYDNDTCIQASDYIPINGPKVMGSGGFRDYKNARAVNLSEIQQYLPDNHPDKQKLEETKPNLSDLYNTYIPLNNEEEYKQLLKFLPTIGFKLAHNNYFKGCPSPTIEFYKNDVFNVLANGGQVYNKKLSISDLAKYGFKLQQTSENMFKKGDCIVITESKDVKDFKANFCFKIRQNPGSTWDCYVELDGQGRPNAWNSNYFKWRYATKEEENEYNRLNKPFDVTTLVKNQPIINNEEWIPQVNEWVIGWHSNYEDYKTNAWQVGKVINEYVYPKKAIYNNTALKDIRKALPHEIPNYITGIDPYNTKIEVGDEVSTIDGNGIVIALCNTSDYLVKGAMKSHNGYPQWNTLVKGNFSNENDSRYYKLNKLKLIKKNNTPQTTNTKTDDFGSLQVTNAQTTDIIIPKRASVTLKITEKEVNINIKKQKPVKI